MSDWTQIGSPASSVAFAANQLFMIEEGSGDVLRYLGVPEQWSRYPDWPEGLRIPIAGGDNFYSTNTLNQVFLSDGDFSTWTQIGEGYGAVAFVGNTLLGIASAPIFGARIDANKDGQWSTVLSLTPDRSFDFVNNDSFLIYRIDRGTPWIYDPVTGKLVHPEGSVSDSSQFYASGDALYMLDDGDLWRYDGKPDSEVWTLIGPNLEYVKAYNQRLIAIPSGAGAGVSIFNQDLGQWEPLCSRAENIDLNDDFMAGLNYDTVQLFALPSEQSSAAPPEQRSAAAPAREVASPEYSEWVFILSLPDEIGADYDGRVEFTVYAPWILHPTIQAQPTMYFGTEKFKRATSYALVTRQPFDSIDGVTIEIEESFFEGWGDSFHVDTLIGWCNPTQQRHILNFKKTILPGQRIYQEVSSVDNLAPMLNPATIYVWTSRLTERVGHSSLLLSDGTYISWWPTGKNKTSIQFIDNAACAANPNQTYNDDVALEEEPPDVVMQVGGLDNARIKAWWNDFRPKSRYKLYSQNCSTTVGEALMAGGAGKRLTSYWRAYFNAGALPWTPAAVVNLALHLQPPPS